MVTTAKETTNLYNQSRDEMKEKTSQFAKEKKQKGEAVMTALSGVETKESVEDLAKKARVKFTKEFKEENKDLIDKYNFLSQGNKLNEIKYQEFIKIAKGLKPDVDEKMLREIIFGDLESKEKQEKSLEFEKDTFKISSEGWEEVRKESAKKNPLFKKFLDKGIKVKANATGDVVEYMEDNVNGALTCKKGEQIFIPYDAFIREVCKAKNCMQEEVEKKYMMTIDEFKKKMEDKPDNSEEYKKFFNEEVNGHLAGYWHPYGKEFYYVGVRSDVWLVGGNTAYFYRNGWGYNNYGRNFGFSGRLLKN